MRRSTPRQSAAPLATLLGVVLLAIPMLAQGQEAVAHVRLVHGVPGLLADVYVDGDPILDGFAFGEIQKLDIAAGAFEVAIVPADGELSDAVLTQSVTLEGGLEYSMAAVLRAGEAVWLVTVEDKSGLPAGKAGIVVRHYAEAVGVARITANGASFVEDFAPFEDISANVDAGPLSVEVQSPDGSQTLFGPADLSLEAGKRYLVFAVGDPSVDFALAIDILEVGAGAPLAVGAGSGGQAESRSVPGWAWLGGALGAGVLLCTGALRARRRS